MRDDDLTTTRDVESTLQSRFSKDQVHSSIGSSILVSINPYKQLSVDTKAIVTQVKDGESTAASTSSLVADVYYSMFHMKQDQSILFQGASGSGKSHSLNEALAVLAVAGKGKKKVTDRVEAAQVVLQAFGNARTSQNSNSSRYGQLSEVQFNNKGRLVGMKISDYLLEKSRITHVQYDERNFHAFYYMLGGMSGDEKSQWSLQDAGKYSYLVSGTKVHRTTREDAQKYSQVKDALKTLGFKDKYQSQVFQLLAALLHLGNVDFIDNESKDDAALIKDQELLENIAHLLGVKARDLGTALVYKTKVIKKEICTVYLDKDEAVEQRDSLVQTLYSLLWMWLIESTNKRLCTEEPSLVVNLVDLFGVDQLKDNYFYQLMYNYTFEKVLEFTNKSLFDDEVERYHLEDVKFDASASYADNEKIVAIFSDPTHGILTRLNEESAKSRKRAKPDALLQEWKDFNSGNDFFAANLSDVTFTVRHHSQQVTYDCYDFVESNAQQISADFVTLFKGGSDVRASKNSFLVNLFTEKALSLERDPRNQIVGASQHNAPRRKPHSRKKSSKEQPEVQEGSTFAGEFQQNLMELLDVVSNTKVSYVFCVSSNDGHAPNKFDKKRVAQQLQDLGINDIIKLKSVAYETSIPIGTLVEKYRLAMPESSGAADPLEMFAKQLGWNAGDYATGKTSVFLKDIAFRSLQSKQRAAEKIERKRIKDMVNESGVQIAGSQVSSQQDDASDDGTGFSDSETADETGSAYGSEYSYMSEAESTAQKQKGEKGYVDEEELEPEAVEQEMTSLRRFWLRLTFLFTFWIPNRCLEWNGMKRADIQQAWREKLTLCMLIVLISIAMLFFITGFVLILCPRDNQLGWDEIGQHSTQQDLWIAVHGMVFDYTYQVNSHSVGAEFVLPFGGRDATACFPYPADLCGLTESPPIPLNETKCEYGHNYQTGLQLFNNKQKKLFKGYVAWTEADVKENHGKAEDWYIIVDNNVYDVTQYRKTGQKYLGDDVTSVINQYPGQDVSQIFGKLGAKGKTAINCLLRTSFVGQVDKRQTPQCQFANQILLAATVLLVSIIVVKFLSALQFGSPGSPEDNDRFVICQVPCYTEGEESLKRTIDSLANLKYDDKRKLLFIVADGNIIGSGNDRPSWRIALDLLGVDPSIDPPKLSFQSLGEGNLQHNMAKVYTGLYDISGHLVPYLLVAKVGKDNENRRPGNRGKRDSQMILMRFLQKVHYDDPMSPLELEMYHQMKNVIGVDPSFYEFILMVDADTEVMPDALNRLVSAMVHDAKIVGLCGETTLANEKESFITMMQVYEYYISHHLAKAFESLFGSVTCLPGCFCMYRIRSPNKSIPLLISKPVVTDYAVNDIDTLHKKNLLSLGEDRYLTTLMLKHFPQMKLSFTRDAMARSIAPDRFNVLLSQRRRWINSTIHNLAELLLLPQLCGFCCFSMRFVVFFDLLATLVMPATIGYLGYLIYESVQKRFIPMISLYLLCAAYGLQFIIFLLRGKFEMMGWMIIYILALPLFSLFIPLYAFWHFDDFSWGNTRIVVGERGGKKQIVDEEPFDPESIPVKKWSEYEQEMWENETEKTSVSKQTGVTKHTNNPNYAFSGFSVHHGAPSQSLVGPFAPPVDYGQQGVPPQYSQYNGSDAGVPMMQQRPVSMMPPPQAQMMMPAQRSADYPSNEQITSQIKNYLATANLMTVTKKQVRDDLALFFNVDMSSRRDFINKVIEDVLQNRQ